MADIDVDTLAQRILAAIGKARGSTQLDDEHDRGSPPNHVPYHRFQESRQQVKGLREQLEALQSQVEQLSTGYASKLEELRGRAAEEVATLGKRHAEDLTLVDQGFTDPLGRQTLRAAWQTQPKDSRGKSPAEWWQAQVEASKAHAADPDANPAPTLPRALTPYLPQPETKPSGNGNAAPGPGWGGMANPTPPQRRESTGVEAAPVDQGWDAFIAALPTS